MHIVRVQKCGVSYVLVASSSPVYLWITPVILASLITVFVVATTACALSWTRLSRMLLWTPVFAVIHRYLILPSVRVVCLYVVVTQWIRCARATLLCVMPNIILLSIVADFDVEIAKL